MSGIKDKTYSKYALIIMKRRYLETERGFMKFLKKGTQADAPTDLAFFDLGHIRKPNPLRSFGRAIKQREVRIPRPYIVVVDRASILSLWPTLR